MRIELHLLQESPFLPRSYDCNDDDVRSIINDACRAFGQLSEFRISGFGQSHWPVDVMTDLPVFLEELPSITRAVQRRMPAEINFYEQGVERSIKLTPTDDGYIAECVSMTSWRPDPNLERISCEELEEMLLASKEAFMSALTDLASDLRAHPWIKEWADDLA